MLGYVDTNGTPSSLTHFDPWGQPLDGSALPTGPGYTGETGATPPFLPHEGSIRGC